MKLKPLNQHEKPRSITKIGVSGYKSLYSECVLDIRPLTVLAGPNSSGKSSIVQPLLLLKQTLEASYDPGPFKLNGPNVRLSSGEQMLSKTAKSEKKLDIDIKISVGDMAVNPKYRWTKRKGFELTCMGFTGPDLSVMFHPEMTAEKIEANLPAPVKTFLAETSKDPNLKYTFRLIRNRSFFEVQTLAKHTDQFVSSLQPAGLATTEIRRIIHLPGLRGNPERNYPVTAVGKTFQGTFQEYTASVIAKWQTEKNSDKLDSIATDLEQLGLTWKVVAIRQNDTQIALQVGRMPHPVHAGAYDLVSIADVGLGVSQTLPVVVALHVAEPGQVVFLEQPEIHLHPRAQMALASVLTAAANRGVIVIVETHSSILLRGIQTAVAQGHLPSTNVSLNWFRRDPKTGYTTSTAGSLDNGGAFGDWPEDFDEVALESEQMFLDAYEKRLSKYAGARN